MWVDCKHLRNGKIETHVFVNVRSGSRIHGNKVRPPLVQWGAHNPCLEKLSLLWKHNNPLQSHVWVRASHGRRSETLSSPTEKYGRAKILHKTCMLIELHIRCINTMPCFNELFKFDTFFSLWDTMFVSILKYILVYTSLIKRFHQRGLVRKCSFVNAYAGREGDEWVVQ